MLVFAAWLNHDDSRSINTLDTLVTRGARSIVRHHLIDFGSTLGSGSTQAQSTRAGNEFIWESRPTLITMLTLGFYVRPWVKVDYPDYPSIGRFESNYFLPQPGSPNTATRPLPMPGRRIGSGPRASSRRYPTTPCARIVETAAVLRSARVALPRSRRCSPARAKVLMAWLNGTNPIVNPSLSAAGRLTFDNAAERAGVAKAAERYSIEWSRFDNAAGSHQPRGRRIRPSPSRGAQAPAALLGSNPRFIAARVRAFHPDRPAWSAAADACTSAARTRGGRSSVSSEIRDRLAHAGGTAFRAPSSLVAIACSPFCWPLRLSGKVTRKMPDLEVYWTAAGARVARRTALPRRGRALPVQIPARVRHR